MFDERAIVGAVGRTGSGKTHLLKTLPLRYARPQRISVWWATQFPTRIPSVLLGETRQLYVFHLDHPAHLQALRLYLSEDDLRRVAALPPRQYLSIVK